jgi:hypothetical protein
MAVEIMVPHHEATSTDPEEAMALQEVAMEVRQGLTGAHQEEL